MNITIITSTTEKKEISAYKKNLLDLLNENAHHLTLFDIKKMNVRSCTGCWSCWVKTPGKCILSDDMDSILSSVINSDLLLYLAEPVLGYVNYRLKMVMDRSIPLVHPYIELVNGECHHKKRYEKYPYIGLILENSEDLEAEDIEIIGHLFRRFALNFKSELSVFKTTEVPVQEVINEINNI